MGNKLEKDRGLISLAELFDRSCAIYMSIGMTAKEFWEGDVCLPKIYMEAYKLKRKREAEQLNYSAWLYGRYNYDAYSIALANAFLEKGKEPYKYPDTPYGVEKPKSEAEENGELQRARAYVALDNFVKAFKK